MDILFVRTRLNEKYSNGNETTAINGKKHTERKSK